MSKGQVVEHNIKSLALFCSYETQKLRSFWACPVHALLYKPRSSIPQPIYRTMSEGPSKALSFRSTIEEYVATYTSPNTFLQKKAAEQDVAKVALEHISKRIKDE